MAVIYFVYISRTWYGFVAVGLVMNVIVVIGCFFIPESPKFLISKKRYHEARIALKYIAKVNGVS